MAPGRPLRGLAIFWAGFALCWVLFKAPASLPGPEPALRPRPLAAVERWQEAVPAAASLRQAGVGRKELLLFVGVQVRGRSGLGPVASRSSPPAGAALGRRQ